MVLISFMNTCVYQEIHSVFSTQKLIKDLGISWYNLRFRYETENYKEK